jgi:hypothetical protein
MGIEREMEKEMYEYDTHVHISDYTNLSFV